MRHLPALIIAIPLASAWIVPLTSLVSAWLARLISITALMFTTLACYGSLKHAMTLPGMRWSYTFGGWEASSHGGIPIGIEHVIDPVSGALATLVAALALLTVLYSGPQIPLRRQVRSGVYHGLLLTLTTGLLGMTITGDLFNLYVFLEITALSAYALLAKTGNRATLASLRYILVGTVAATFYLIGLGHLYAVTGTLNMADLSVRLSQVQDSRLIGFALILITLALLTKMAVFPFHSWQSDVYTYAPPMVIPFIAGTMSKVVAYTLFRLFYTICFVDGSVAHHVARQVLDVVGVVAAISLVAGSVLAIAQKDVRRMLAYSSTSQISAVALGLAIGNASALIGAFTLAANHAFAKACLFVAVGNFHHRSGAQNIEYLDRLGIRMPLTGIAFTIAALSIMGLPPTGGFFGKWYLLSGAVEKRAWGYVLAIVVGSLLSAVYFARVIERLYVGSFDGTGHSPSRGGTPRKFSKENLPFLMVAPMAILVIFTILVGFYNYDLVSGLLQYMLPAGVEWKS